MNIEKRHYDLKKDATTFDIGPMPCGHTIRAEYPFSPTIESIEKNMAECPVCLQQVGAKAWSGPFDGPLWFEEI